MAKKQGEQTEIEAPYELPEGWKWCRLGDVAEYINGRAFKPEEWETEGKPIIRIQNLTNSSDSSNFTTKEFEQKYLIKAGDLLFAWSASLGAYIWNGCDGWLNQHIFKVVPFPIINKMYLYNALLQVTEQLYAKTHGSGMVHVTLKPFLNTLIPLPPTLEEQQRIVNRIETLFAKLDQAKEKAQNVVDTFETRKASILHKAFNNQLKICNEELKDEDWIETTIGECCRLGSGGTPSKSHPEYYEKGDIPWLNTGEIDWNEISTVEKKITQIGVDNSSAKLYPAESVVVAMYGMGVTRGKAAIIKIPTTTNQAVCVLQTGEKINNRFLFYYFMCNYWNFREKAVGGNQLNYSATMISKWKIKLPPINYQLSIVNFLDGILEKEIRAKEAAEAVLEQINLLKKSILARAFRGEL